MFMGPFGFIIAILMIVFVFSGLAVKWDHDFKLRREQIRAGQEGSSLGTSELRALIQEAMLDAIAPLEERLELIEKHMRQLPESTAKAAPLEPTDPEVD